MTWTLLWTLHIGKIWCGVAWYVAKEEVEVRKLKEPIVCQQFPRPELEEREESKNAKALSSAVV